MARLVKYGVLTSLGDRRDDVLRAAHLREHLVEPLQRAVKVDLDPAGRAGHVLPVVLRTPTLHKGHPGGAHINIEVRDQVAEKIQHLDSDFN